MELLFPVFLEDEQEYDQAVSFWRGLFRDLLAETDLTYAPYLNTTTVHGLTLRDGNPIFDAYFPELQKAIRIIQEEPESGEAPDLGAWLQQTEMPDGETVAELVIALVLAEGTLPLAKRLIGKWVVEDVAWGEMVKVLEEE